MDQPGVPGARLKKIYWMSRISWIFIQSANWAQTIWKTNSSFNSINSQSKTYPCSTQAALVTTWLARLGYVCIYICKQTFNNTTVLIPIIYQRYSRLLQRAPQKTRGYLDFWPFRVDVMNFYAPLLLSLFSEKKKWKKYMCWITNYFFSITLRGISIVTWPYTIFHNRLLFDSCW